MELEKLYSGALTLILVAVLVAIGITVIVNMSTSVLDTTTYTYDSFLVSNSSCITLTNEHISSETATFENQTADSVASSCFTWDNTAAKSATCVRMTDESCGYLNATYLNVSYTYGVGNSATTALDSSVTSVGGFVTWFAVIVVMLATAVILGIVMKGFTGRE